MNKIEQCNYEFNKKPIGIHFIYFIVEFEKSCKLKEKLFEKFPIISIDNKRKIYL